jgi:hypothetical protein
VATVTAPTFADIENLYCGTVYPNLEEYAGDTALCLFCAEWLGMQDAYWVAKAGLIGTCVDVQGEKLEQMREVYPEGWEFVEADVYAYAHAAVREEMWWDVVTLDPWTGQFDQCAKLIDTWSALARKVVVLGHGNYRLTPPEAPEGWELSETIKRSDYKGGIYWLVFKRSTKEN